ncbi:hypothetical protein CTA1_8203 [Colletotrichum tanaceti]|uniref:Uncharacterized protein n=1 Tax=Colletotrichum tanaceti TaxID=1306861 RepID=A0A4U6XEQ1_9PEZI|nr:hypothetical protein CTA1_8203 [Colletotrichum tanaceti]
MTWLMAEAPTFPSPSDSRPRPGGRRVPILGRFPSKSGLHRRSWALFGAGVGGPVDVVTLPTSLSDTVTGECNGALPRVGFYC